MEHMTEALYMSAATVIFALAVSIMLLAGRSVDRMFAEQQSVLLPGQVLMEEAVNE